MNSRLSVFVCGTYSDLSAERGAVLDALQRLEVEHHSMELFRASSCRDHVAVWSVGFSAAERRPCDAGQLIGHGDHDDVFRSAGIASSRLSRYLHQSIEHCSNIISTNTFDKALNERAGVGDRSGTKWFILGNEPTARIEKVRIWSVGTEKPISGTTWEQ
jgi:hypothetical protein